MARAQSRKNYIHQLFSPGNTAWNFKKTSEMISRDWKNKLLICLLTLSLFYGSSHWLSSPVSLLILIVLSLSLYQVIQYTPPSSSDLLKATEFMQDVEFTPEELERLRARPRLSTQTVEKPPTRWEDHATTKAPLVPQTTRIEPLSSKYPVANSWGDALEKFFLENYVGPRVMSIQEAESFFRQLCQMHNMVYGETFGASDKHLPPALAQHAPLVERWERKKSMEAQLLLSLGEREPMLRILSTWCSMGMHKPPMFCVDLLTVWLNQQIEHETAWTGGDRALASAGGIRLEKAKDSAHLILSIKNYQYQGRLFDATAVFLLSLLKENPAMIKNKALKALANNWQFF